MRKNYRNAILACSFFASLAACTDVWEDHYQVNPTLNGSENLWELISSDPELEDFAALLHATGYDTLLAKSRNYTVWAPTEMPEEFDVNLLSDDSLVKVYRREIVENHIADFSHVAGGIRDKEDKKNYDRVVVLNGKAYHFEGTVGSDYSFAGNRLTSSNIVAKNGVLHKLDSYASFASNIWEQLAKEPSISTLYNFLKKDYKREFNPGGSVAGPIKDGKVTYLDSAFIESCRWFYEIGQINEEDSSYTVYALTNKAWNDMYDMARGYYIYPSSAVTKNEGSGTQPLNVVADSLVKEMLVRNLIFSNTVNKKYFEGRKDTLRSTSGKIFKGNEADSISNSSKNGFVKKIELSNGTLNIVDKVNYNPFTLWHDTIRVQGESLRFSPEERGEGDNAKYERATVEPHTYIKGDSLYNLISNNSVGVFTPTNYDNTKSQPDLRFYVDGVKSAHYRISIVLLPPHFVDSTDNKFIKPNKFNAKLSYIDDNGNTRYKALNESKNPFISDPTKVDTIVLAECQKIDFCEDRYKYLTDKYPVTSIMLETNITFGTTARAENRTGKNIKPRDPEYWKYDNSYRVDEVIFEPVSGPVSE